MAPGRKIGVKEMTLTRKSEKDTRELLKSILQELERQGEAASLSAPEGLLGVIRGLTTKFGKIQANKEIEPGLKLKILRAIAYQRVKLRNRARHLMGEGGAEDHIASTTNTTAPTLPSGSSLPSSLLSPSGSTTAATSGSTINNTTKDDDLISFDDDGAAASGPAHHDHEFPHGEKKPEDYSTPLTPPPSTINTSTPIRLETAKYLKNEQHYLANQLSEISPSIKEALDNSSQRYQEIAQNYKKSDNQTPIKSPKERYREIKKKAKLTKKRIMKEATSPIQKKRPIKPPTRFSPS